MHVEDLTVPHLGYLAQIGLDSYAPSVSLKLTPALIRDHCRVPFFWRLNESPLADWTPAGTERWVFEAMADGSSGVCTGVWRNTCTTKAAANLHAFVRAAKKVESLLAGGCPREQLRKHAPAC